MAQNPSTSRERIIPIQIESRNEEKSCLTTMDSHSRLEDISNEEVSDEPTDNLQLEDFDNDTSEVPVISRMFPMFNVKERIVFIIDSAEDENFTPFRLKKVHQNKPLDMLKRAIEIFLYSKQMINKKHEYALAVLNENSVVWLANFTNNITTILNTLQTIESCVTEDIFQLNNLFNTLLKNVEVPELCEMEETILPPPYVVRGILLYGRSYTMPKLKKTQQIDKLLESPYFILDVLMTHEPVDECNNCNKIFKVLQNLDRKGYAYFLPVARDTKALFNAMAQLLSHPLQRPTQQLADYSI